MLRGDEEVGAGVRVRVVGLEDDARAGHVGCLIETYCGIILYDKLSVGVTVSRHGGISNIRACLITNRVGTSYFRALLIMPIRLVFTQVYGSCHINLLRVMRYAKYMRNVPIEREQINDANVCIKILLIVLHVRN